MMVIVSGLRFIEKNVDNYRSAEIPGIGIVKTAPKRILQQQLSEIWFEVEQGILVMKDKKLGWADVPMDVEVPNDAGN